MTEDCAEAFIGAIECDETMFGGHRRGKRGWDAAGISETAGARQVLSELVGKWWRLRLIWLDGGYKESLVEWIKGLKRGAKWFGMGVETGRRKRLQVVAETLDCRANIWLVIQAAAVVKRL